ncbi:hypothetical protein [Clostridium sp. AWRP]|uniref:hypothetical protein n=1 Tax=Clostridium sp. AWRP TaxID=2212991 RepID=UPI000FDA3891|nr:hypothetical protein [Clostridium sp. AWRP]AZV56472.1 hypothetical protein DMR38_07550 [Clostridium sp. AWRP]
MNKEEKIYIAFGLVIKSDIKLPELIQLEAQNVDTTVDINIKIAQVSECIKDSKIKSIFYEASLNEYLLKVDGIAKYYVKEGKNIIIEPNENSCEEDIRVFLLNSVFAVVLQQRGFLVLHASAAVVDGKAVIFSGISNSGKTAIALSLYDKGYGLICDEICPIKIENGKAMIFGGIPQLNVWQDTLVKEKKNINVYTPIRKEINKYAFNIKDKYYESPIEISDIVLLKRHNKDGLVIKKVKGVEKFGKLMKATYRFDLEELMLGKHDIFNKHLIIGRNSCMFEIMFNDYPYEIDKITDFILKELKVHE